MKITIPILIEDTDVTTRKGLPPTEEIPVEEQFFLDGPVGPRVAILDFEPTNGELAQMVRLVEPADGSPARYGLARPGHLRAPDFIAVSVFGTVLQTMAMFEEADTLGRPLVWAFAAPQLLVVPRAGEWQNAFYERASNSLQFFYFQSERRPGITVHSALSHDIVAHETGHAVLDGIAPDLYDAITPQSLALHEAIADLTALNAGLRSKTLCQTLLEQTNGSIDNSNALSWIAEEFARARDPRGRVGYLRTLRNDKTLRGDAPAELSVDRSEPHALSEVLSGALYKLLIRLHQHYTARYRDGEGLSLQQAAFKGLWVAAQQCKRMIFRALDYLPPGEVSFADYGRALIAADQASHPSGEHDRDWLADELVDRGIADSPQELSVASNYEHPSVSSLDLDDLVHSDWAAYGFANANRELLRVPAGVPFEVRDRLDVTKRYYHRDGPQDVRECIFKVSWTQTEPNPMGPRYPKERRLNVGTTLAIDWATRTVRACLTSRHVEGGRRDRDELLSRLARRGLLAVDQQALAPDGRPRRDVVAAETAGDVLRVRGAGRTLHITEVR